MRRGCIAVEEVHCDKCGRGIKQPERYLIIDEETDKQPKKLLRYCVDCSVKLGYATHRVEKGEEILTFLEVEEKKQA